MNIVSVAGWIGASGILLAYSLSAFRVLSNSSRSYKIINSACALLLIYNAFYTGAYPFVMVNSLWAVSSFISLFIKDKQSAMSAHSPKSF